MPNKWKTKPTEELIEELRAAASRARMEWPDVYCVPEDLADQAADRLEEFAMRNQNDA